MTAREVWSVIRKILCTVLLIANIVFIFYNSSQVGAVSSGISLKVMDALNGILSNMGVGFRFSHTLIRKLGHFGEYAMLGFWLMLVLRIYTRRVIAFVSWPLLGGLFIAVCDEFYQTFIPGRSGEVRDVVIDFAGVCTGLMLALVLALLFNGLQNLITGKNRRDYG